jgi:hypothetical protein
MTYDTYSYSVPTIVRGTRELNQFFKRKTRKLVFEIVSVLITLMSTLTYVFCSLVPLTIVGTEYES